MGISVAASAIGSGLHVCWASEGRSEKTRARAEQYGLTDVHSLAAICESCEILLSICPPHAAEDVARSVVENEFKGLYLDANAIAPQRAIRIGALMADVGIHFVDGGIIGGPAWTPKETWLYLSGNRAEEIAACFANGPLETKILGREIGQASALKMCYAAYSKGTSALLAAILATAESLGVRNDLYEQWNMDDTGFSDRVDERVRRVAAKAWRFEGEMREIAATFREAGLPGEFHEAAAEIYRRMTGLKDGDASISVDEILGIVTHTAR
jgi:3-hydroxyisobutyrate dehydrogenase-like beta-hydroxyacid dehydrogenase